ncbi:hypothetical protein L0657_12635 [Dyadobacter sp. CY345]|uniref:hypothetical protein n=1 Tax=Dyadobacter sp. CY345 TaxID=2909335 RepID=UPI001F32AA3C|nr:hypothetical protein [Dyadobacter sp. CY345]MCF2444807.1 hypothetical protein [Dyadobacter sp. CY345]
MKSSDIPSPHIPLLFTDLNGTRHKGFYNQLLNVYVEKIDQETSEEIGISYPIESVLEWEYEDDQESSDPDIIEIL